jgi:GNAT superfamily N-acetyltransferase
MAVSTRLAEPSDFDTAMDILGPFAFGLSGGGWPLEDAAALASARTLWTDELCGSRLRGQVFLAEDNAGKLLGVATQSFAVAMRMAVVSARAEYTLLEELIVGEAGRGKGVGQILVQACLDSAKERGCANMGLYVADGLTSRPFYDKLGFQFDNGLGGQWGRLDLQRQPQRSASL